MILRRQLVFYLSIAVFASQSVFAGSPSIPSLGDKAPDFTLKTIENVDLKMSEVLGKGPVVLVVLRGYPGYQCPICSRQVGELVRQSPKFRDKKAAVVLVYPGPSLDLDSKAKEFLRNTTLPENFSLVLDPDYRFTNAYGLRWNAPKETAYPSTFVLSSDGKVVYSKISKTHGGRADVSEVMTALTKAD